MIKPIKYYVYCNLNSYKFVNIIHRTYKKAIYKIPLAQMRIINDMEGKSDMDDLIRFIILGNLTKYK